jgi:hypothetical protein
MVARFALFRAASDNGAVAARHLHALLARRGARRHRHNIVPYTRTNTATPRLDERPGVTLTVYDCRPPAAATSA